jgi:endo-1,4-beta-D-glucanase Y
MKCFLLTLTFLITLTGNIFSQAPSKPFPQHVTYTAGSIKPNIVTQNAMDKKVKSFYIKWKNRYLVNGCAPDEYYVFYNFEGFADPPDAICVSEGQGYGMIITALMAGYDANAKIIFDGLYNYYKSHPSIIDPILMGWQQTEGCINVPDADAATDGDLDIAYGLLLAHIQWGSAGAINYLTEAQNLIDAIYNSEINHNNQTVKLGDWVTGSTSAMSYSTRSSDFMPDHFRLFAAANDDLNWNLVTDRCYSVIQSIQTSYSPATGLMPDFIKKTNTSPIPAPPDFLESSHAGDYYYNACRVPWRIATDYLVNGDTRAFDPLTLINTWIKTKTSNTPANIKSGYSLGGDVLAGSNYNDLSFQAPFGVSAMISSVNQTWLNNLWNYYQTVPVGRDGYYGNSIKMLSMIIISGNWWAPDPGMLREINNQTENNFISVVNPVHDQLNFTIKNKADYLISIHSLDGREIYSENISTINGNTNFQIDVSDFSKGVYLFTAISGEQKIVKKIVIQ